VLRFLFLLFILSVFVFSSCITLNASASPAKTSFQAGKDYLKLPDYFKAYDSFLAALKESRAAGDAEQEVAALLEVGKLSTLLSRPDDAEKYLKDGLKLCRTKMSPDYGMEALFELELGEAEGNVGNIEAAGDYFRKAIQLSLKAFGEHDIRTARIYSAFTGYFSFKHEYDSEMVYSKKAFAILNASKNISPDYYCAILLQHTTAVKESYGGNHDSLLFYFPYIRSLYRKSLDYAKKHYSLCSNEEGRSLQGLANTYTDRIRELYQLKSPDADVNWKMADSLYNEAVRAKRCALGNLNASVATTLYTRALIYWSHTSLDYQRKAPTKFNDALAILDTAFLGADPLSCPVSLHPKNPYFISVLLANKAEVLGLLYSRTKDRKYLEAQHIHNRARLILWDYILASFSTKDIGSVIAIWNHEPFEEAIATAYAMAELTGVETYLNEIYDIAEKGKNNVAMQLLIQKGIIKIGQQQVSSYSIPLGDLQEKIPAETVFIEFVQAPVSRYLTSYAIVITKNHYSVLPLPSKGTTDTLQAEMYAAMRTANVEQYEYYSKQLYDALLKPLLQSVGSNTKRLVICPSGTYGQVPFEALVTSITNNGRKDFRTLQYVVKNYTVSYALSAGSAFGKKKVRTRSEGFSVFVPSFDTLPQLLFARRQAESLESKYHGNYYFDQLATWNNFMAAAPGKSIVQLSTHAVSGESAGSTGALFFRDTVLQFGGLYEKSIPIDLCIISACQTGSGRQEYGEGTKSFAREFAYAGADGTISTLWCVDDKATASLLTYFYEWLEKRGGTVDALSGAKQDFIKLSISSEMANPFYWAGLVYSGDPYQEIQLTGSFFNSVFFYPVLLLVIVGLAIFYRRRRA
jgi:CHAT domain-containing protein